MVSIPKHSPDEPVEVPIPVIETPPAFLEMERGGEGRGPPPLKYPNLPLLERCPG